MENTSGPTVALTPLSVPVGGEFVLSGERWPNAPVSLRLGRARAQIVRIDRGRAEAGGIVPEEGAFSVQISTRGLEPGAYRIRIVPRSGARTRYLRVEIVSSGV